MIKKNNIATKALVLFKMYGIIEIFQKNIIVVYENHH
jgi:hypothetical protein